MDPITFATIWMKVRPFHLLKLRREARRAAEAAGTPLAPGSMAPVVVPDIGHPPEHVDAVVNVAASIVGGAKSKLIWLAVAQFIYAAVVLYINGGALTAESLEPLLGGLLTAVFRVMTGQTLAEKGA